MELRKLDHIVIGATSAELMLLIAAYLNQKGYKIADNLSAGNVTPAKRPYKVFRIKVNGGRVAWVADGVRPENTFAFMQDFVDWMEEGGDANATIGGYEVILRGDNVHVGCQEYTLNEARRIAAYVRDYKMPCPPIKVNGKVLRVDGDFIYYGDRELELCSFDDMEGLLKPEVEKFIKAAQDYDDGGESVEGVTVRVDEAGIEIEGEPIDRKAFNELVKWIDKHTAKVQSPARKASKKKAARGKVAKKAVKPTAKSGAPAARK